MATVESIGAKSSSEAAVLPWLFCADRQTELTDVTPGEYVLRTLFYEFTILTDKKLEHVLAEPLEKPLSKSLQRGEDPQFDQLLSSLNAVAKYSLSSLLKTLFHWYSIQKEQKPRVDATDGHKNKTNNKTKGTSPDSPKLSAIKVQGKEMDYLIERRDPPAPRGLNRGNLVLQYLNALWNSRCSLMYNLQHAIDFLLCLVLIEVLKQLPEHPVDESLISHIEGLAFKCFKQRSSFGDSPSATNAYIIAALYAEVIGVLAQTRFQSVRKRFRAEFKENSGNSEMLVNVICGMKYLRIKLFPVEHVEETFMFLQDCANVFIDTRDKDKDVKYALAGVFVEILVPVAATAKRELHIPALKNLIDLLYPYAFDMSKKTKHLHAMYPLVAVLLCVSQKQFFLTHWPFLLSSCLTNIKHRDTKLQRICLDCLYRMLWVYVIRIKGENNSTTLSRLRSVTDTLFPRGSRSVNPRDVPITIFVKIVHFISHYNLDFAMTDIIFDLLSVGRFRQLYPERMNIGLRSFLVIVDSLQKKEGDPPMPNTSGTLPSGSSLRVKKSFLNKPLTEEAANDLGISKYFHSVCKALDNILHNLDLQVGRPLMKNNPQCSNKDPYDMITGERKPKIDLFRTSVASIPKLIPRDMSKGEVVGLLSRLTIHVDEELRSLAFSSLQSLILDFVEWREDVIVGFVNFIVREVQDHHATLLDGLLRMVLKMLAQWKTLITMPESERKGTFQQTEIMIPMNAIHCIEGCGLAMLCSVRQIPRKLALLLLKEARVLGNLVAKNGSATFVMDIIDEVSSSILAKTLKNVSPEDKSLFGSPVNMDLQWFVDKLPSGFDTETGECGEPRHNELWASVISELLLKKHIPDACPVATQFSWQAVHHRLFTVYSFIDQSPSGMDSLTSLGSVYGRSTKKVFNLSDVYLWQNYLMFACTVHPVSTIDSLSCENDNGNSSDEGKSDPRPPTPDRVESLFRFAVALVRHESSEIRNAVIACLGKVSPASYKEFLDELQVPLLQYVLEKRAENRNKRKKRDNIRTYLARIFELNAERGCFRESPNVLSDDGALSPTFVEYIENTRLYFCSGEADRDPAAVHQLKLNFARFMYKMIKSIPCKFKDEYTTLCRGQVLTNELRANLFSLLSSWCSKNGSSPPVEKMSLLAPDKRSELEIAAIQALCAVLYCGPAFDKCGLASHGYFYQWIENVLCSTNGKINCVGQETVELLLDLNDDVPALLEWVINKCYTGSKVVSNKCFQALTTVMIRRPYPCEAIPVISVVLFKTSSADPGEREKAAQLLQLLERRFLSYCVPGLSNYSQSPMELSDRLANFHPELTIPLLSELTFRFETAPFTYQRIILKYMLPWLCNVQLVDITSSKTTTNTRDIADDLGNESQSPALMHVEMTGDGWGSSKATQLVLNNLFFLTVKYGEDFNAEFEELWTALANAWIGNNHEVLNFLNILAGVGAHPDFFTHAKRLVVYLVRANKEGTIQTLMEELQLTEPVAPQFERCEQPPYYTLIYKDHSSSILADSDDSKSAERTENEITNGAVKHTDVRLENLEQSGNSTSAVPSKDTDDELKSYDNDGIRGSVSEQLDWARSWVSAVHNHRRCVTSGLSLPVPLSAHRFAALIDVLPQPQMVTPLYRCNFSLILLSEVIRDQPRVDWLPHLPLILHVVFLGFDHSKSLIHEHCKSLLVNLSVILVLQGDYSSIAHALMKFHCVSHGGADVLYNAGSSIPRDGTVLSVPDKNARNDSYSDLVVEENKKWTDKVNWLIWYLKQSEGKPLWNFEDITTKSQNIRSATELTAFLVRVLDLFDSKFQGSDIRGNWARVASKWAISCSSRHYAGRSFQVLRGLSVQLSWSVLSDILSRLAESVGDNNEDVQGYVMEILLTLDSVVEQSGNHHVKPIKVVFLPMEDENEDEDNAQQMMGSSTPERSLRAFPNKSCGGHIRSLSSGCDLRVRHVEQLSLKMRSVSLQSLRLTDDNSTTLSQTDLLSRIFWVAVSLLESDFEHEFVTAVKLLSKVVNLMDLTLKSTQERLESLLYKLKWSQFSGVQMLLLKGLTSSCTSVPTIELIKNTTPYSNISIMDVSEYSGVALSILALLPYMIQRFNEPDEFCLSSAAIVSQVCVDNNMLGFGKLFTMYNHRTYHKTVQMWTEGVCRYIYEFYRQNIRTLLAFLTELLERGPQINQTAVLNITCGLMRHIDFKLPSARHILIPTLKVISKHIKDDLWKESLNVLKLAVSSCSQLEMPVQGTSSMIFDSTWSLDQSVARLELPGKTLDFTFDVSNVLSLPQDSQEVSQKVLNEAAGWKRPQLSQRRTKERLVSVLHVCGHHIGLKQSPSVVFSSSSDLMVEKLPGSEQSSSDDNQYVEGDSKDGQQPDEAQQLIGVFTGFDFLDDEIDEHDDDISGFGWDIPSGEYTTTPEPGERSRHSPLSGSEPDIVAAFRVDTSDEDDDMTRSLSSTVSPSIAMPLTKEALRAHDQSEGFSPTAQYNTPPSESSQESAEPLSPRLPRFVTSVLDMRSVDEQWKCHVTALVNDNTGFAAVNSFTLLALLLRQIRRRVNEITRQCCNVLDNSLFGVTSLFIDILEALDVHGECHHVYMDSETVRRSKILERQKFMVLEIDDHYRSYKEMLHNAVRALDRLRGVVKPLGEYPSSQEKETLTAEESRYEDCEIALCWALYKLHFQVLLFLDSYSRLFEHLRKQASKADIVDLTNKVGLVRNEIISALASLKHPSSDELAILSGDSHTYASVTESIVRNLHTNNTEFAVKTLHAFRDKIPGDGDQDDVGLLTKLYARYLVEKKPGAVAMSKPEFKLPTVISELKEMTIHILSVIEQLSPADKT